jgi:LmbE family N-acetylglucosaminyl deacetylase
VLSPADAWNVLAVLLYRGKPCWKGRHPDHSPASILGHEACFFGLQSWSSDLRPRALDKAPRNRFLRIALSRSSAQHYYDIGPISAVDIGDQFEGKFTSIMACTSQFSDQEAGKVPGTR